MVNQRRPWRIVHRVAISFAGLIILMRVTGCDRIYSINIVKVMTFETKAKLGRWPENWSEVVAAGGPNGGYGKVSKVEYSPLSETRCKLKITGLNIFLWNVTDTETIDYPPTYTESYLLKKRREEKERATQLK